jgi:hypothetical protein
MCRLEPISFDLENKVVSTFCLYDCLEAANLGMLAIGVNGKVADSHIFSVTL